MKILTQVKGFLKELFKKEEYTRAQWEEQNRRSKRDYFSKESELERNQAILTSLSFFVYR